MYARRAERRFSIRSGAQLNLLRAYLVGRFNLFWIRIDEQTRQNSCLAYPADRGANNRDVAGNV